ncbi:MAG: choice-of-anchor D domain-containing protein, partial [Chloroflexaceae bacterium]|nr:choice-of-anchor D domain-containing protein [Chloroflexaceae bacterium]
DPTGPLRTTTVSPLRVPSSLPISLTLLNLSHNHLSGSIPDLSMLASLTDLTLNGNQLSGDIPTSLSALTSLVNLDLGYNRLTASDPTLLAFLEAPGNKDPDWRKTQTLPPTDITAETLTDTMVRISWTPILYTGNGGFYRVWYAAQPAGGDYLPTESTTANKSTPGYIVTGLQPDTTYSFLVRTFTPAHTANQNALTSTRSLEVSATTLPPSPEISVLDWNGTEVADNAVTPLDLGTALAATPLTRTFTVRNLGTTSLVLTDPVTVPAGFALNRSLGGTTVTAGGSITFDLVFEATRTGIFSGELSFGTNDHSENPFNFPIQARGTAPDIQVLDWNNGPVTSTTTLVKVNVGQTAVGKTLTRRFKVKNTGDADLILTHLTVPTRYTIARTFAITTVRPGSSTTFDIALTTTSAGVFSGTLSLLSNDPDENPFAFTVTGTVTGTIPNPFDCPTALAVTEGMAHLKADTARATYLVDGSGITVGVIANSYDDASLGMDGKPIATRAISDVLSGDLPGVGNPCGYPTPVQVIRAFPLGDPGPGGDEGRAVMQIIHDIAPGARLLFASGIGDTGTFLDLAEAIRLLHEAGADMIVDTMYDGSQPFYQDGPVSAAVAEVVEAGGIYFTTAGNFNRYTYIDGTPRGLSYEALAYRPAACPAGLAWPDGTPLTLDGDCHTFSPSTSAPDPTARYVMAPASLVKFHLQWGEPWYGVTTDLDLYAVDDSGTIRAASASDNTFTQLPYESLTINTAGSEADQPFSLVVNRPNAQGTPQFKYIVDGVGMVQAEYYAPDNPDTSPDIFGPTIFGHRGANAAISVSAVPYTSISRVEDTSSRGLPSYYFGPININGDEAPAPRLDIPEMRQKPDIAATDGNATTFYGRPPPHHGKPGWSLAL